MWLTLLVLSLASPQTLTAKKLINYADFEHPNVTYWNPKYIEYVTMTAQRYSRRDLIHYVNIRYKTLTVFGNNITMTYNGYEFLSNEYRPSLFVMTFQLCHFFSEAKYAIFKPVYIQYFNTSSCPFPVGEYVLSNLSIPINMPLLSTFPYQKGRLFISLVHGSERVAEGYIDGAIKQKFI